MRERGVDPERPKQEDGADDERRETRRGVGRALRTGTAAVAAADRRRGRAARDGGVSKQVDNGGANLAFTYAPVVTPLLAWKPECLRLRAVDVGEAVFTRDRADLQQLSGFLEDV